MSASRLACFVVLLGLSVGACGSKQPEPGTVRDEAMRAGLAAEHFVRPTPDYFRDMDFNVVAGGQHHDADQDATNGAERAAARDHRPRLYGPVTTRSFAAAAA